MITIYKGHILFTKTPQQFEVIENGYIAVENGKIIDILHTLSDTYQQSQLIDYGNKLIVPGMNDLHVHAPQYRNLGIAMDMELLPWLQNYTFPEEIKYSDESYARTMYQKFIKNSWQEGTTRCVAFATSHTQSTELLMQLYEQSGLGAYIGKVAMNRNCPTELCEEVDDTINDINLLIKKWNKTNHLVKPIITPRFIPSCTPELLTKLGQIAIKQRIPVQSHLSENQGEIAWIKKLEPNALTYGHAYDQYQLFGQTPTLMAHCCYTKNEELELMEKNGVIAVHCPTSNCNLGSGIAPIRSFLNHNVPVALGSDISAGHSLSIFKVMVYAIQVSKLWYIYSQKEDKFLSLAEVFYMATKSGGSFFGKVGSFEPGYEFDALVIDDTDLNHDNYTLLERLERFIYIGDNRQIKHRYVRGKRIDEPTFKNV